MQDLPLQQGSDSLQPLALASLPHQTHLGSRPLQHRLLGLLRPQEVYSEVQQVPVDLDRMQAASDRLRQAPNQEVFLEHLSKTRQIPSAGRPVPRLAVSSVNPRRHSLRLAAACLVIQTRSARIQHSRSSRRRARLVGLGRINRLLLLRQQIPSANQTAAQAPRLANLRARVPTFLGLARTNKLNNRSPRLVVCLAVVGLVRLVSR